MSSLVIEKRRITENDDYNLSADRYRVDTTKKHSKYEMVSLEDVFKLSSGRGLTQQNIIKGQYPVYGGNGINGYHNEYFIENPVIVIGRVGAYCGAVQITQPKSWVTDNGLYVTNYLIEINQKYLAYMLSKLELNQFAKVGGQPSISQLTIYERKIPLPPISIQQEIVNKIEQYEKIISGAKQVVENYKPQIDIKEDWEMVELGSVLDFVSSGATPLGGSEVYKQEGTMFIRSQNILWGENDFSDVVFIDNKTHNEMKRSQIKQNDILLNITGASIGRCSIFKNSNEANVNQHVAILRVTDLISPNYLMQIILNTTVQTQIWSVQSGGTRQALNYSQIKKLKIPLPSLQEQETIVSQIEKEQQLVNANKELIKIYEQKIKNEINKLWVE